MLIKTEQFKKVADTILPAVSVDKTVPLELVVKNGYLYLNVTNTEYYVSAKFELENPVDFRAVVDATAFLDLVSGITTETFELVLGDHTLIVKMGKSSYKFAMIEENDALMVLPIIKIDNVTVDMSISNDILKSILDVNSKEISKLKNLDANELQKLYYIDETGCFTFTTGACLNSFKLEKPVKLLLNERIVKLFKLFKEDVSFSYGCDPALDGTVQTKVAFITSDVYVAAKINCDDLLLKKVSGPCSATKDYIGQAYDNHLVISASKLSEALKRLTKFSQNNAKLSNSRILPAEIVLHQDEIVITNKTLEITEVVPVENDSYVVDGYTMTLNLIDLALVIGSYVNEHVTLNCGNHRSVVISCGAINNLIPEGRNN